MLPRRRVGGSSRSETAVPAGVQHNLRGPAGAPVRDRPAVPWRAETAMRLGGPLLPAGGYACHPR